ncbi:MAG: 50S ribosomal protein L18 [Erysipelothrix sp.]|nr:50S ribosomal protein L18 [Erysipelothrix sp.]
MLKKIDKNAKRVKRHSRMRNKIHGTSLRPRLNVFRSNTNIYAQIIDDVSKQTLVSASSLQLKLEHGGNIDAAKQVGAEIAKLAKDANITEVVFDRGGYVYHGRVKALAEAAREAGLQF